MKNHYPETKFNLIENPFIKLYFMGSKYYIFFMCFLVIFFLFFWWKANSVFGTEDVSLYQGLEQHRTMEKSMISNKHFCSLLMTLWLPFKHTQFQHRAMLCSYLYLYILCMVFYWPYIKWNFIGYGICVPSFFIQFFFIKYINISIHSIKRVRTQTNHLSI